MTVKKARAHEILCQGPKFDPQAASYAGNSSVGGLLSRADSSSRNVAPLREWPEVAKRDSEAGSLPGLLDDRTDGNGHTTSIQEGTAFECDDDDDDDDNNYNHSDDNDENDNNEDKDDNEDEDNDNHSDNDDTAFVENSSRCHGVDTSRSERVQCFYEVRFTPPQCAHGVSNR